MKMQWLAVMAATACAFARADDNCDTCKQKKPKCETCETKRCGNPIKNFFVHSVGGTIGGGLKKVPCKFEGAYNTTADTLTK